MALAASLGVLLAGATAGTAPAVTPVCAAATLELLTTPSASLVTSLVVLLVLITDAVLTLVHLPFFHQLFHTLGALASDFTLLLIIHGTKTTLALIAVPLITIP
jgi:hypothetical protein